MVGVLEMKKIITQASVEVEVEAGLKCRNIKALAK